MANKELASLTAAGTLDATELALITQSSNSRKITLANLWKVITALTAETAPATDDELPIYDLSATTTDKITLANLFKVINSLTLDSAPDTAADSLVTYDDSASAAKKVLLYRLFAGGHVPEVTVASAGTTDILGAASPFVSITGTTTITSLGTGINRLRFARFTGALTLTHNATSLILPSAANITTAAGDTMIVESDASSNVRVLVYQRADGTAVGTSAATQADMETATSTTLAVTPGRQQFHPGHPKCWAYVTVSGGTPTLQTNYNITSITDTATGRLTVTIATDFSTANWSCPFAVERSTDTQAAASIRTANIGLSDLAAGSVILECRDGNDALADPASWHMTGLGDQ